MSKLEVDKIDPQSGTALEIGSSGDTITIPSGATLDASNATTTLPANVVTTDGTQTLTNKTIDASQLSGTITPSDGTVTSAKIGANAVTNAKLNNDIISGATELATEPADTDEFLVSDAGILKRIDYSLIKSSGGIISSHYDDSQSSITTTSLSFIHTYAPVVAITPASTSSKFLVIASGCILNTNNSFTNGLTIFRDSTNLSGTTADDGDMVLIEFGHHNYSMVYLDSPNTTSQITYKIGYRTTNASGGARINPNNTQSQIMVLEF